MRLFFGVRGGEYFKEGAKPPLSLLLPSPAKKKPFTFQWYWLERGRGEV